MRRGVVIAVLSLTLAFAGALGAIHAQPYDLNDLRALLAPDPACAAPCFLGVRPGHTTPEQASALLRANDWVARVDQSDSQIVWSWSGRQPRWIAPGTFGQIILDVHGLVGTIKVPTTIPTSALWIDFGVPATGYVATQPRAMMHFVAYPQVGFGAVIETGCPTGGLGFYESTATLYWGIVWNSMTSDNDYRDLWRHYVEC